MNIRSVTCFLQIDDLEVGGQKIQAAGRLAQAMKAALEAAGFPVQTTRLATQPLSLLPGDPLRLALAVEAVCADAGFDYLSLGPVLADAPDADLQRLELLPELIRSTQAVFAGVRVAQAGKGVHLEAIRRTARAVRTLAHTTDRGFGNLRLAMLANVGPLSPFFPAAYHDGGLPAVALATESADMAVRACSGSPSLAHARDELVRAVESAAERMVGVAQPLARQSGFRFAGIDFSLAPFPEEARSIGAALEHLGGGRFGAPGTLFMASFLTGCLRQAHYPRCGFNGLMLPVLEDTTLANRSGQGFSANDLLLYSAVCGTGLDTLPLPGDVTEEELAGILLDVAALALRLDKPLTARLMPIPGAQAGDLTQFDFAYFANGHVLDVQGSGSPGLFQGEFWLDELAARPTGRPA